MERKIFKRLTVIALLTLVLSTISSLMIYYDFYKTGSEKDLTNLAQVIKINLDDIEDDISYLEEIKDIDKQIRISYFNSDGNVIFDSKENIKNMSNHSNRPEFKEAIEYGIAREKRYSDTLSKETYNIALKTKDGLVIRISRESDNILGAFLKVLPMDILLSVIIFIFAILLSKYATKKILEPLNEENLDINNIDINTLPELSPFIREIKYQNETIYSQLIEMERDRETISAILENMREGIVILDSFENILVVNESTLRFLNCNNNILGENFLNLSRNEKLINSIRDAFNGKETEGILNINERSLKYILSSIYSRDELTGVVLLLIDETEDMKTLKIREDFSANVSHELKTPVTSIYGFSELLNNNMVEDEKDKKEFINHIYEESKRLLFLIEDIIKISSMEKDDEVSKVKVDLEEIVNQVFSSLKIYADDKNIKLSKKGSAKLSANSTMMWELILNLVQNAIKYNNVNGYVEVILKENDEYIEIIVKDNGIGISDEDQLRIFERFYRVDKSRSKKSGGTGLGLSIVKHIVLLHEGKIDILSEENIGTSIKIQLKK